jgi:large subunit ribosomal protein L22
MVLALIRGQDVAQARDTLRLCDRGVAAAVGKLLDSAIANAEHNDNIPEDELFIVRAYADEGPTMKRWRPRARGRGTRIRKRTSHITIAVTRFDDATLERRRQREASGARPVRRRTARPTRRVREAEHDHDHDHDEPATSGSERDRDDEQPAQKPTAKKTVTKKAPAEQSTAKKAPAKKKTKDA